VLGVTAMNVLVADQQSSGIRSGSGVSGHDRAGRTAVRQVTETSNADQRI
jgi:hypothetical protein